MERQGFSDRWHMFGRHLKLEHDLGCQFYSEIVGRSCSREGKEQAPAWQLLGDGPASTGTVEEPLAQSWLTSEGARPEPAGREKSALSTDFSASESHELQLARWLTFVTLRPYWRSPH